MVHSTVAQKTIRDLRHRIARIEGRLPERLEGRDGIGRQSPAKGEASSGLRRIETGAHRLDACIGGGFPSNGLMEVHSAAIRDAGAVAGFVMALASLASVRSSLIVWIAMEEVLGEAGLPHIWGAARQFGIVPGKLIFMRGRKIGDVLWIAEQATSLSILAIIVLEVGARGHGLGLTSTQRLHRRALASGHLFILLRQAGMALPTAAPLRLVVRPAPSGPRSTLTGPLEGSIGPPAFHVSLDKNRLSPAAAFILEWVAETRKLEERSNAPTAKIPVGLAAVSSDGPDFPPAVRQVVAFMDRARDSTVDHQPPARERASRRVA